MLTLFRSHVARRSESGPGGETRILDRVVVFRGLLRLIENPGDSEIGDLDLAVGIEQQILGLDVTVDDSTVVGILERLADRGHHGEGFLGRESVRLERLSQIDSLHEFHDEVEELFRLAEVMHRDDVGMTESGERLRLAGEAVGETGLGFAVGSKELERDDAVEQSLAGAIDDPHSTDTDQFENFELGKSFLHFLDRGRGGACCLRSLCRSHRLRH